MLPGSADREPERIAVDEDLFYVFGVDGGWLAVCETSIRRLGGGAESASIQFGEVVQSARLVDGLLTVVDMSGTILRVDLRDGGLVPLE